MMQKFGVLVLTLLFSLISVSAMAVPISVNYTADNAVLYYQTMVQPTPTASYTPNPLGVGAEDWKVVDFSNFDVAAGYTVNFMFVAQNDGVGSASNPAGFIADITVGTEIYSTSSSWMVAAGNYFDGGVAEDFYFASAYGSNSEDTIWSQVNGGPVTGISADAQWIWTEDNSIPNMDQVISIWTHVDVKAAPVPEPATMLLLGTGLVGIAGASRKKIFKKK